MQGFNMMSGKFKEYNWRDIQQLILKDCGLVQPEDQRSKGQIWYIGGFNPPEYDRDTVIRVSVYDKEFSERIEEHAGDNSP